MAVCDVTSTIVPPPWANMPGRTAWISTNWATTLAASLASSCSTVSSTTGTMLPGPVSTALFTSRSTPPQASATCSTARRSAVWSCRSATSSRALVPDWRMRAAVSGRLPGMARPIPVSESSRPSPGRRVRPMTATSHPEWARARAVALPIPRVAPVTTARRPASTMGLVSSRRGASVPDGGLESPRALCEKWVGTRTVANLG